MATIVHPEFMRLPGEERPVGYRDFFVTSLGVGFARAVLPVSAQTITTSIEGLVAGAIRIKFWHFTLGTAIGILPGTLTTILVGNQIETALSNPGAINYWPVAGAVALLIGGAFAVRKWLFDPKFNKPPVTGT